MHATMRQHSQSVPGGAIRGTFYPSEGPRGGTGAASVLPKILAFVAVIAVLRTIARAAVGPGMAARRAGAGDRRRSPRSTVSFTRRTKPAWDRRRLTRQ